MQQPPPKTEGVSDVLDTMRQRIAERGQAAYERQIGVSKGSLSHILSGRKSVSQLLAAKVGYEIVWVYRRARRG
jgi:hypothetical protein